MSDLTIREQEDLADLEEVIEKSILLFHEVGRALLEISARRLYRQTHASFEAYCQARWGFQRAHAYRLISASEVVDDLSPFGGALPANEAQARPMVPLAPGQRREVWEAAQALAPGGRPTAADVEAIAKKALAGLAPEAQARVLRGGERELEERREERISASLGDTAKKHFDRACFHLRQARKHFAALGGDEGQPMLGLVEEAIGEASRAA